MPITTKVGRSIKGYKMEIVDVKGKLKKTIIFLAKNSPIMPLALSLGIILALFISSYFRIEALPLGSKRLLAFTILVGSFGFAGYLFLLSWLRVQLKNIRKEERFQIVILSLVMGPLLFWATTSQWMEPDSYLRILLPEHRFEISVLPENEPEAYLSWFSTSFGKISFDDLRYYTEDSFYWEGYPGEEISIIIASWGDGQVLFSWDGEEEILTLDSRSGMETVFTRDLDVPWYASRWAAFLAGAILYATLALIFFTIAWQRRLEWFQKLEEKTNPIMRVSFQNSEWIFILGVMLFSFILRSINLEALPPHLEEYNHLNAAKQLLLGAPQQDLYQRSYYVVTLPVAAFFSLFGVNLWAARLPGILMNSIAIIPLYFLAKKINHKVAILACVLYATSPLVIALSRTVREYAYYPFFFYLILLGVIKFLEIFPKDFVVADWKKLLTQRIIFSGFLLLVPIVFALIIDSFSTFKVILLIYFVFLIFLFTKFNLKDKWNLLFLTAIALVSVIAGIYIVNVNLNSLSFADPLNALTKIKVLDLFGYFFFNPPQQWYYDRLLIIPVISLIFSGIWAFRAQRKSFIPLFINLLYLISILFFLFFFKRGYAARFFLYIQLWHILLFALGLYSIRILLSFFVQEKKMLYLLIFIGISGTFNIQQIFKHSKPAHTPITSTYHMDFQEIQSYLLQNANPGDVLVSKYYGRYANFVGTPEYKAIYEGSFILEAVAQNDTGWIVVDSPRYWYVKETLPRETVIMESRKIEYVGEFNDGSGFLNYLWHWSTIPAP